MGDEARATAGVRPAALLSFDFEDWNQLVARDLGLAGAGTKCGAFERQMSVLLRLLDELGLKATFFILGMTARVYPELVEDVAQRGHEIACHGDGHVRVFRQTRDAFRHDLERGIETIERLVGVRPRGYRAPWFSINRDTTWAYATLVELGFEYDSSQYSTPLVRRRMRGIPEDSYRLVVPAGGGLAEFPVAVWRRGPVSFPIGGGSYWRLLPTPVLLRALRDVAAGRDHVALYLHPHELDPDPLRVPVVDGATRRQRAGALYNRLYADVRRGPITSQLRAVARELRLVTYGEVCSQSAFEPVGPGGGAARTRAVSAEGVVL
jgi:polysaccharide deacetylase family protein (PEP-CTERM system associated)